MDNPIKVFLNILCDTLIKRLIKIHEKDCHNDFNRDHALQGFADFIALFMESEDGDSANNGSCYYTKYTFLGFETALDKNYQSIVNACGDKKEKCCYDLDEKGKISDCECCELWLLNGKQCPYGNCNYGTIHLF